MSPKDVAAFARMCRKHGIVGLKLPELELVLDPHHAPPTSRTLKQAPVDSPIQSDESLSPEDILFYSSTPHDLPPTE